MSGQTTLEPAAGPSRPGPGEDARRRSVPRAALGAAFLVLLVLAAYLLFGHAEARVAGTTPTFPQERITTLAPGHEVCQLARVPAGTGAVQVLTPRPDERVSLTLRPPAGGAAATAARAARAPDLGLRLALDKTIGDDLLANVCLRSAGASVPLLGDRSTAGLSVDGKPAPGALALTFYRPGKETAAQMLPVVAQRIGRMRGAFGGAWRLPVIVLLLAAGLGLSAWLLLAPRRRTLAALFAVVVCNALAWSLFTPALQIPDEPAHISYVQDLVEKGQPPQPFGSSLSPELNVVVDGVGVSHVNFRRDARPPWTAFDDAAIRARLATKPSRVNQAWYLPVSDYPPLYYGLVSPVYRAVTAAGGSTLDAITPLRAVSALFSGFAVIAVFGFLLELFPERRFLALAIALVCAYQPLLSYISGGVTPDSLLIPLGAAMFWLFARSFRRGLTARRAAGLGLLMAAMLLTKVAALGLVPGWLAGVALLLWRARGEGRRPLLSGAAAAGLCAAVPLVAYALLNAGPWNRPVLPTGLTGGGGDAGPVVAGPHHEVSSFAVYLWEYVLPRFGTMTDFFHSSWTPKDLWVPMWLGRFGWSDYGYPAVVNRGALIVYLIIAVAAVIGLVRLLRGQWDLWAPIAVSALLGLGLIAAIGKAGYPLRASGNYIFEQGRYYLPLICLFALALALAASLLRRRIAHALVVVVLLASIVQLGGALGMTVARYYTFSGYIEQENAHAQAR